MIEKKIELWLNHPNLDPALKEELKQMNEQERRDAFYTTIAFGTAGMRGLLGVGTNRMNIHTLRKANVGFATYICDAGEKAKQQGIAIAYDNRHMSKEFAMDSARLLATYGIKTYVFESLRPTPELSFATRLFHCFGGIMITASHNPKEYNGYKLYDADGCQLIPELANQVIARVNAVEDELSINVAPTPEQEKLIEIIGEEVDELYYEKVLSIQLNPDVKKDIKIVFSPEHGTSNLPVRELYKRAGYNCIPVLEQCDPDPDFSNTKTPNPEEAAAYEKAIDIAKQENAEIILVCDPDADRMGVGVQHQGEYIILTGNQSGALLIEYILGQRTQKGSMPKNPILFNTVVTGDLGEKIAASYGVETEKTLTGFKFIGEKVAKYEKTGEKTYVFGYEESYGSLISPFVRDKDAPQACLMLAEAAAFYKQQGKTLVDVLNDLYEKHGFYDETQFSIMLAGEDGAKKLQELIANLRKNRLETIADISVIGWEDYGTMEEMKEGKQSSLEGFSPSDVLKYYLSDGSWIAVRPSGTEPKCKVYFCVLGSSLEEVERKSKQYQQAMKKVTSGE